MKKRFFGICVAVAVSFSLYADVLVQWDFNFPATGTTPATNSPTTGTFTPYINNTAGSVTFTNIGGTTNSFGSPPSGGSTATSDPWVTDNSALRLGQFPSASANNKTAGIQFFASTVGYENIQVVFDQENSATASRYWRAQYTTDGTTWNDYTSFVSADGTSWLNGRVVDLSTVTGVKNNPNFGFRYVSEFQSTATGSGVASYVANSTGSGYSANGTFWTDYVTITGTPLDNSNTDPTISAISDQSIQVNHDAGPLAFTVGDAETPAGSLTVSAVASVPSLIQGFSFGGSGTNRTITVTPQPNQSGLTMITVTVTDGGGKAASSSFDVLIRPPTILVSNVTVRANSVGTTSVTIGDSGGFLSAFTVSATATNSTLLPPGSIAITGTGTNRTLTITPATNQLGGSVITVTATDGSLTVNFDMFFKAIDTSVFGFWDFNSKVRDSNASTGDQDPSLGGGTSSAIGDVVASLNSNVSAVSSDLDQGDNSKWRLGTFPAQGTSNKLAGAEFHVSTVGRELITMNWEHYNSASGSRYWRLQYSTDGVNFTDFNVYTNLVETTWVPFSANFSSIPALANNPNFAVRLVSEFESTATGAGTDVFKGVQASGGYSTGGTLWLDSVTFSGVPYNPANTVPTITAINTQTTRVDTATSPIAFTISDAQTSAGNLVLTAFSSTPSIANDFSFGGSGNNRTITITPQPGQTGNANITVRVTDEGGKFAETVFQLVVLPANTPPVVSGITNQTLVAGTVANVPFSVNDLETSPDSLTYSLESFNPEIIPASLLQVIGSGQNKTLQITAATNAYGASKFRMIVSDGVFFVTNIFNVKIVRPQTLALWDYNSNPPDTNTATGLFLASLGAGTATNIGSATATFGVLGSGNADNRTTDPAALTDNSSLRLATFPTQSTSNKTTGVEFRFSTVGYSNIVVTWDQQNSATASRYWRVQYTTDGNSYTDHVGYTNLLDGSTIARSANFSDIAAVNNNPNFGMRIVSEWESTATGQGGDSYIGVQTSGGYGTGGTFWTDMVLVTADGGPVVAPVLQVQQAGNSIQISWPSTYVGYVLQDRTNLGTGSWQTAPESVAQTNGQNVITVQGAAGNRFFRLTK